MAIQERGVLLYKCASNRDYFTATLSHPTENNPIMRSHLISFILASLIVATSTCVLAQSTDDTPENRGQMADRYLKSVDLKDQFAMLVKPMTASLAPEVSEKIARHFATDVDYGVLAEAMKKSLVKTFTLEELKVMTEVSESPVYKKARSKMGALMADVMPALRAEIARVTAKDTKQTPDK